MKPRNTSNISKAELGRPQCLIIQTIPQKDECGASHLSWWGHFQALQILHCLEGVAIFNSDGKIQEEAAYGVRGYWPHAGFSKRTGCSKYLLQNVQELYISHTQLLPPALLHHSNLDTLISSLLLIPRSYLLKVKRQECNTWLEAEPFSPLSSLSFLVTVTLQTYRQKGPNESNRVILLLKQISLKSFWTSWICPGAIHKEIPRICFTAHQLNKYKMKWEIFHLHYSYKKTVTNQSWGFSFLFFSFGLWKSSTESHWWPFLFLFPKWFWMFLLNSMKHHIWN